MKEKNVGSKQEKPRPKGIRAVHTFSGQQLSDADHQKLIKGPIAAVADLEEASRGRIDRISWKPLLGH